eukprot:RCo050761
MRIAILAALPRFCMGPSPSENVPVTIPRALYFCLVMALSLGKGKSFSSQKGSRKGSLLCLRVSASLTALGSVLLGDVVLLLFPYVFRLAWKLAAVSSMLLQQFHNSCYWSPIVLQFHFTCKK